MGGYWTLDSAGPVGGQMRRVERRQAVDVAGGDWTEEVRTDCVLDGHWADGAWERWWTMDSGHLGRRWMDTWLWERQDEKEVVDLSSVMGCRGQSDSNKAAACIDEKQATG